MSVLSLGKWPGSVVRPLRAGNLCPPARRPEAGVRTPVAEQPPAAERLRAPRLDQTEFAEWPGRAGRTAVPGRSARPRRAGRPERILRLVQPGETAQSQSQSLPAALSRGEPPPRQVPPPVRVPRPRQAPPIEQASPAGPDIQAAPRRPVPSGRTHLAARPGWSGEMVRAGRPARPGSADRPGQAVRPGQAARPRPRTRLTRRGRRVVWAFATLLLIALLTPVLLVASAGAQAANHGASPAQLHAGMQHVVVQPGQSLWSIAVQAEPQADPRAVIQQIIQYNALSSDVVAPGESLWVPGG
jgi:hypothetical protein